MTDTPVDTDQRPAGPAVTVTERETQREQIARLIQAAIEGQEPLRIRIPLAIYDAKRNYVQIREAAWSLSMPSEGLQVEQVEEVIQAFDTIIAAIGRLTIAGVVDRLTRD